MYLAFVPFQRIDGIAQKVVEYLSQHRRITRNFANVLVQVNFEFDRGTCPLQCDFGALFSD